MPAAASDQGPVTELDTPGQHDQNGDEGTSDEDWETKNRKGSSTTCGPGTAASGCEYQATGHLAYVMTWLRGWCLRGH